MEEEVLEEEETPSEAETEENVEKEEPSEAVQEYKFKHDGKDVVMKPEEFEEFYSDWSNEKKWKTKLNDKGRKLNKQRDELESRAAQLKTDEATLQEYKKLKKAIEANPQAYGLMNKLLNEAEPSIDPAIKKLEADVKDLRNATAREKASIELSKKFEDYSDETLETFTGDFELDRPLDAKLFTYYAWKGSQLDDILREEKAALVREAKKKKGMPATSTKQELPPEKFKDVDDWANKLKEQINAGTVTIPGF